VFNYKNDLNKRYKNVNKRYKSVVTTYEAVDKNYKTADRSYNAADKNYDTVTFVLALIQTPLRLPRCRLIRPRIRSFNSCGRRSSG
jgi:hypothetical protein